MLIVLLTAILHVFLGAGKTHTMLGTQDNPGIYFRALNDLFRLVETHREENVYNVSMSYLEVSTILPLTQSLSYIDISLPTLTANTTVPQISSIVCCACVSWTGR